MSTFVVSISKENDISTVIENNIHLFVTSTETPQPPGRQYGYDENLNGYRNNIDNIDADNWKKVRWYINQYDFLVKDPIINRAFYKYWEIVNEFEIFESYKDQDLILHCAEAPGGFIQGTNIYLQIDRIPDVKNVSVQKEQTDQDGFTKVVKRKQKQQHDFRIYTISLNKDLPQYKSYNLPSYNKNILNNHVCVTYGKDNTGDINNWENIEYIKHLANHFFYLITADGGFDEGTDFNNKEQLHYCLILSEIYSAISLQKTDGHFILKVFDVFTETSIHLLYLLFWCYNEMYVYKPKTSRPTNSEKYIICKSFCLNAKNRNNIKDILIKFHSILNKQRRNKSKYVSFKIFKEIPSNFVEQMKLINGELLKNQCSYLEKAVTLCQDTTFLENYESELASSIDKRKEVFHKWEEVYNLGSFV